MWKDNDPISFVRSTTPDLDFKNPDYAAIEMHRSRMLVRLRDDTRLLEPLKAYYRANPADFISDWGWTFDPRNPEVGLPSRVPFVLFPRQRDWVEYAQRKWLAREPALSEKSRECGLSWLAVSLADTLALLHKGVVFGFGSRKEEYVDKIGDPKSLFWKARYFLENLPPELAGEWNAAHMRIMLGNGSMLTGEAGDNIGRGNRTSAYFVDEAAFLEHPLMTDAALSQTTNCRHDISSANGLGNPFEQRRHGGNVEVFTFHWRDDPRKDEAWYQKQVRDIDNPTIVAQELDIDYAASVEGVLIPHAWAVAAIGAHAKLNITPTGRKVAALDVADEGKDLDALCVAHGVVIEHVEEWTGKGSDIFETVQRAFNTAEQFECDELRYDSDGLGAGVRGDSRVLNEARRAAGLRHLPVTPFRGSEAPSKPEREDVKGRKNKDFFANRKAQAWWQLHQRFLNTYRWLTEGIECDPDATISISESVPAATRLKLCSELAQPTWSLNGVGKMSVDKSPEGARSPNLADAVMIKFAEIDVAMVLTNDAIARATGMVAGRMPQQQAPTNRTASGWNLSAGSVARALGR